MEKLTDKPLQSVTPSSLTPEAQFELGRLHYERTDFNRSVELLTAAVSRFFAEKKLDLYLKCQNLLLRIYAERGDTKNIQATKEKLQDLVIKEGFELSAKSYYTLGVCASLRNQEELGLEYFQKALALALSQDSKEDICYAISGIAITYYNLNRLEDALKEIYNLQVFFQVLPLTELQASSQLLNAHILRKMGKYEQALEVLWKCYENLRIQKNLHLYIATLYGLGITFQDSGDKNLAKVYLQLARKIIDDSNLTVLARQIDDRLTEVGGTASIDEFDLIYDATAKTVFEKKRGQVDFKNQFILLDLLHLFMKNPGEVYSKENLVQSIWKQEYDPRVHDNKIYVTIKRLRKLIEPDFDKPRYIFRAKNGYYLNKSARVHLSS